MSEGVNIGMDSAAVRSVAENVVNPASPVRNEKTQFGSTVDATEASKGAIEGAAEKGIKLRPALKRGVDRFVSWYKKKEQTAWDTRRASKHPPNDAMRQFVRDFEGRATGEVVVDEAEMDVYLQQKAVVDAWDNDKPRDLFDALTDEQRVENDKLFIDREMIGRNERYQQQQLAEKLVSFEQLLEDDGVTLEEKAKKLQEVQQIYTTIKELSVVSTELHKRHAELLKASGALTPKEVERLDKLTASDEKNVGLSRNRHPIGSDHEKLYSTPISELNETNIDNRSVATKGKADELMRALKDVRGKEMTPEQEKAYLEALGLKEVEINGKKVFDAESGSVLETVLLVQARKEDVEAAFDTNLEAIKDKKDQNKSVERAFESANLLVQSEAAEVITHAMVLETVNQVDAKDAIKAAEAMGSLDEANKLRLADQQSREIVRHLKNLVGGKLGEFWDHVKGPLGNVGKGVLITAVVALALAILATSALGSMIAGGGR
jgi:hypothetical protein